MLAQLEYGNKISILRGALHFPHLHQTQIYKTHIYAKPIFTQTQNYTAPIYTYGQKSSRALQLQIILIVVEHFCFLYTLAIDIQSGMAYVFVLAKKCQAFANKLEHRENGKTGERSETSA